MVLSIRTPDRLAAQARDSTGPAYDIAKAAILSALRERAREGTPPIEVSPTDTDPDALEGEPYGIVVDGELAMEALLASATLRTIEITSQEYNHPIEQAMLDDEVVPELAKTVHFLRPTPLPSVDLDGTPLYFDKIDSFFWRVGCHTLVHSAARFEGSTGDNEIEEWLCSESGIQPVIYAAHKACAKWFAEHKGYKTDASGTKRDLAVYKNDALARLLGRSE